MTDVSRRLTVGTAQVAEVYLDREASVSKDVKFVRRAGEMDLDLLVFPRRRSPENSIWSRFDDGRSVEEFYRRLFENAVEGPDPEIDRLSAAAREANVALVVGVNERESDTAGTM